MKLIIKCIIKRNIKNIVKFKMIIKKKKKMMKMKKKKLLMTTLTERKILKLIINVIFLLFL